MATVTTTFSSDSSSTERALVKLQSEYEKLKDKIAAVGKASKEASKEGDQSFGASALSEIKNYAAGLLSIGAAVSFVSEKYGEWRQAQKQIAEGQLELERTAAGEYFRNGGSVAGAERIGLDPVRNSQLLGMVRTDAPDLSDDRALAIAMEAAKVVRSGVGLGDVQGVASFAGQLGEVVPDATADDLLDLSTSMQQSLRGDFGKVQSDGGKRATAALMKAGKTFEEALGIIGAAAKNDIAPKTVEQLAAIASGSPELKQGKLLAGGRRASLSAEDEAYNRFVMEKSVTRRIDMALNDELVSRGVLGDAGGAKAGMIGRANIDAETARYLAAQRDNLATTFAGGVQGKFGNAAAAEAIDSKAGVVKEKASPLATAMELSSRARAAELSSSPDFVTYLDRYFGATTESFNEQVGAYFGTLDPNQLRAQAERRLDEDAIRARDSRSNSNLVQGLKEALGGGPNRSTPSIRSRPEAER